MPIKYRGLFLKIDTSGNNAYYPCAYSYLPYNEVSINIYDRDWTNPDIYTTSLSNFELEMRDKCHWGL